MSSEIEAAGGVVVRDDGRVALVHRPRYDDWTLPKGKLDAGETFEEAALREVEEETGLRARARARAAGDRVHGARAAEAGALLADGASVEDPGLRAERRGRRAALAVCPPTPRRC